MLFRTVDVDTTELKHCSSTSYLAKKVVTLKNHVLHDGLDCAQYSRKIFLVKLVSLIRVILHHLRVTDNHWRCSGISQPISPLTAVFGAYLPSPR